MARIYEVDDPEVCMQQISNWDHIVPVVNFAHEWKMKYFTQSTSLRRNGNVVMDSRYEVPVRITLTDEQIQILEECDRPLKHEKLSASESDIQVLLKSHLLLDMERQYLNLVEPTSPLAPVSSLEVQLPIQETC